MARTRRIDFVAPAALGSLGRNGRISTHGIHLAHLADMGGHGEMDVSVVLARPIRENGDLGRSEISFHPEALGEVAAFFAEAFARNATPEALEALRARMDKICDREPDPGIDENAEAAQGLGMRF